MTLEISFSGDGETPPIARAFEVCFLRNAGGSAELTAVVDFPVTGDTAKFLDDSLTTLAAGEIKIIPTLNGGPLFPNLDLSLVGMEWRQNNELAEIRACATRIDRSRSDDDPFIPRHRVLHAKNLKELAELFPAVAMLSDEVAVELEKVEFADGADASIIQPGISDYRFLTEILSYGISHQQSNQRMYPVMTGGTSDATAGRWVITWGDRNAYETLGAVEQRFCDDHNFLFTSAKCISTSDTNFSSIYDRFPSVTRTLERKTFSLSAWEEWIKLDMPVFSKHLGHMAHQIQDRIIFHGERPQWTTHMALLPDNVSLKPPEADFSIAPWSGVGIVTDAPKDGPWIEVEIPGFEEDAKTAKAKLVTTYGGPTGVEGFHFVPGAGTTVYLTFVPIVPESAGSSAHALLLACGNVRVAAAQFPSPSIVLPEAVTWELADQNVEKVGTVNIVSDLVTIVGGANRLNVTGDSEVNVSGKSDVTVTKDLKIFATNGIAEINTGANNLELKGGSTQISMKKSSIDLA